MSTRWLITGISTGIGAALAEAALDRGDHVVGTTRSADTAKQFAQKAPGRSHAVHADVANSEASSAIVAQTLAAMGGIDILVNNAGYALAGAIESIDDQTAHDQFQANFFGPLALIREALPALRESGRGRILNISSNSAIESYAGLGMYCASKAALSAMTDSLDQEVAQFGIRAIAVEPTGFRTAFGGASLQRARSTNDSYGDLDRAQDAGFARSNGKQKGDPNRAAAALITIAMMDDPPRRIPLGSNALDRAKAVLQARLTSYEDHAALSRDTDFSV